MPTKRIPESEGQAVWSLVQADLDHVVENPSMVALACRWSLQLLRNKAPGRSVEVRVPPFGAVQIIEGTTHSRGTPPAVIEASPRVWLELASGRLDYDDAVATGMVNASGLRADLKPWLPLTP